MVSCADQMTRIEFEADLLKDEKVEREEEVNKIPKSQRQSESSDETAKGRADEAGGSLLSFTGSPFC